ncbi:BICD family-like cargo adapter 1 [Trichonephila clavata]|uniref:BICD family-like cargo adapter 1 n=1 Tax=Trichonephila clavata TaxID=2740835 RepID=A0A8X6KWS1_TRICU|nr:BICD family-like cargo adapter 1 [Trichonephila clavata]
MSACGVTEMQQTSCGSLYGDLEEYLSEVERRAQRTSNDSDDIYTQLAQREKDLVLAAELGKALLEKNEEISRANERLAEEYSHKLELLEQEKHALRRKLDVLESEYDSRVSELQSDLNQLQKELALQNTTYRTNEKEKGQLLEELTEQNHRLTSELKQATRNEDQLQSQLQALREQFNVRRSNLHDHVSQLEGLREEINLLSERKYELEKRIAALSDEREGLNVSLEESSDRILLLERRNREQEQQLRLQQRDIDELRQTNSHLQNRLDVVLRRCGTPINGDKPSLFNEIEMSSQSSVEDELRSPSQCGRSKVPSHPGSSIGFPEDEIECDDSELALAMDTEDSWKFREELVPIYRQLRRLCEDLRRRRDNFSSADSGISHSPEEIRASEIRLGMLTSITKELGHLIEEALMSQDDGMCMSCQSLAEDRETLEKVQKELLEKNEEIKRKTEDVSQLIAKLTLQETELNALRESRNQLQSDVENSTLAKDQVVKKAWEVRDQAVARKNAVEIELARTRIDVMHINSQLMEAVQQKVELSQQLEQWKMDMEVLLDNQVMKKLKNQEQEDKKQKSHTETTTDAPPTKRQNSRGKLFRLWR